MDILEKIKVVNNLSSRLDSVARGVLLAIVFLLPLVVLPTAWLPPQMIKMALLSFGVLSSLILWSIARINEHKIEFPKSYVLWASLLLLIGYFLTAILSSNVMQSLVGFGFERDTLLSMFTFVGFLAVVALTTSKVAHIIRLQKVALISFLVLGIFQIVRIVFGASSIFPNIFSSDPTATLLGSWNDLAVFSGLALIMALSGLAFFSSKKMIRIGLYSVLTVALFLLIVTNISVVWATLAIFIFILAIYIFSDASYDKENEMFKPYIPIKRLLPSTVIILISIVFLIGGSAIGQRISQTLNISYVDVRPSWQGTVTVGAGVFKDNAFFGTGPNSFSQDWIKFRPLSVNQTNFWNTNFNFGIGFIPTTFITGGLVLGLLWLLFFVAFIRLGFQMLVRRISQPAHMYIAISSFIGAAYLWTLSIVYVPQIVMLAYTFALTGTVIAAAHIAGVVRNREIQSKQSYKSGVILTGVVLFVAVISIGMFLINSERVIVSSRLSQAVTAANNNNLDRAENLSSKVSLFGKDVRGLQLQTQIGLVRLNDILNKKSKDKDAQRKLFQKELTKTISSAQAAVAIDRGDYQNWIMLADIYARLVPLKIEGSYDSAVQAYKQAENRYKKNPAIPIRLARLDLTQEKLKEAKTYIKEALALKGNYTDAYYLLSQISIKEGDVKNAIKSTESAVLLQPGNTGLLFQLGILQYSTKTYKKAIPVLERAVAINPKYSNALYYLGLSYDKTGNEKGALVAFKRIESLNPKNKEIKAIVKSLESGKTASEVVDKNARAKSTTKANRLPVSGRR